jgi:hypothetical protein
MLTNLNINFEGLKHVRIRTDVDESVIAAFCHFIENKNPGDWIASIDFSTWLDLMSFLVDINAVGACHVLARRHLNEEDMLKIKKTA